MNNTTDQNIKLIEKVFARGAAEHFVRKLGQSDFARGMFCKSEIGCIDKLSVLCVFLNGNGDYIGKLELNHDFGKFHDRIFDKVKSFAEKLSAKKVILARRTQEHEDIKYIVASSVFIAEKLREYGFDLIGYYLVSRSSYINILPEEIVT